MDAFALILIFKKYSVKVSIFLPFFLELLKFCGPGECLTSLTQILIQFFDGANHKSSGIVHCGIAYLIHLHLSSLGQGQSLLCFPLCSLCLTLPASLEYAKTRAGQINEEILREATLGLVCSFNSLLHIVYSVSTY